MAYYTKPMCSRTFKNFFWYNFCINKKILDESFSNQYIKKLIKIYKPEYIYGEDQRLKQIELKIQKLKCLNFILFKTKFKKNNKINKKNLLLISTSGSTNSPKFVRLSNINLIDNTKKIIFESFKVGDNIIVNLENLFNKDKLGLYDNENERTILKFY